MTMPPQNQNTRLSKAAAERRLGRNMKRQGILNSEISRVLSYMGHTDRICISDCGLPIPEETKRIDLALRFGTPSFMEVLAEVAKDMKIEKIYLAQEIKEKNPQTEEDIFRLFAEFETGCETGFTEKSSGETQETEGSRMPFNMEAEYVPHEQLKEMTKACAAVIRTGETTPYANIILQSGCIF